MKKNKKEDKKQSKIDRQKDRFIFKVRIIERQN